ncbi:MAG TPA: SIMPL domain-containing protein [Candidatus Aquabacterium excrementipullorum]|nr:SIMPL domain-containing protein [Candidatus Aquabacterium excrementipullorum]
MTSPRRSAAVLRPRQQALVAAGLALLIGAATLGATKAHAQAAPAERRNAVSFSATATQELTQDLLIVTLQANKDGAQAAEVQAGLKQQLDAALVEARKAVQPNGALDVRTGSFSIHPRYTNQGKVNGWQGQAQLVIEGTDMARIAQTVGRLNQLNVVNVRYDLSRALREKHESQITANAITAYRAKAVEMAKAFGYSNYTLGEVTVQTGEGFENRPVPMMMKAARAEAADSAPLPVEPGKGTVTATVSGVVILTP